MQGHTDDTPFIIVDVDEHPDGSTPTCPLFHTGTGAGRRNVMHMPFATGMRIDLQCLPTTTSSTWPSPQGVRDWLAKVVDPVRRPRPMGLDLPLPPGRRRLLHRPPPRVLLAAKRHTCSPLGRRGSTPGHGRTDAATAIATA